MRILSITGQGLRWIGALVLVLWGCILAENSLLKAARIERVRVLVELRHMREGQRPVPASQPVSRPHFDTRPALG